MRAKRSTASRLARWISRVSRNRPYLEAKNAGNPSAILPFRLWGYSGRPHELYRRRDRKYFPLGKRTIPVQLADFLDRVLGDHAARGFVRSAGDPVYRCPTYTR